MAIKPQNQVAEAVTAAAATNESEALSSAGLQNEVDSGATQEVAASAAVETKAAETKAPETEGHAEASSAVLEEEPEPEVIQASAEKTSTGSLQKADPEGTKAVAVAKGAFLTQIMADLAEEGFEGTELDYSSFLNITLNKQIETSEGHELPNGGFLVRLASARKKFCFRNNNPVEDEVEVAYSYDINAAADPESQVAKSIAKWKEEGLDLAAGKDGLKEYLEVLAVILDDKLEGEQAGELNGKLVTIQIAPTSQGRWAGYLTQLKMAKKHISDVATLVRRGKKVESGKFPFYPWDFVNRGAVEE